MKTWAIYVLLAAILVLIGLSLWFQPSKEELARTNRELQRLDDLEKLLIKSGGTPAPPKIMGGSMNLHFKSRPAPFQSWYCTGTCLQTTNLSVDSLLMLGIDGGLQGLDWWIPYTVATGNSPWILELDARDASGKVVTSQTGLRGLVVCTNPYQNKPGTFDPNKPSTVCDMSKPSSGSVYYMPFPQDGKTGFYDNPRAPGEDGSMDIERFQDQTCNASAKGDHDYCEHIGQVTLTVNGGTYTGKCVDGECEILIR